jgi:adenosylhomocysteinase
MGEQADLAAGDNYLWTRQRMPLVYHATQGLHQPGARLLINLPLTWETLCLVDAVRRRVGQVTVIPLSSGDHSSLQPATFAYLDAWGITYYREATVADRMRALGERPTIILDCTFAISELGFNRDLIAQETLIIEDTRTGGLKLRRFFAAHQLKNPFTIVDDCPLKREYENRRGIGYSVIAALMSAGLFLPGKTVLIVGYGPVGEGVAHWARKVALRVLVTELDDEKASRAGAHGLALRSLEDGLGEADVVITATGAQGVIGERHFRLMRDFVILVNAGAECGEWDQAFLRTSCSIEKMSRVFTAYTFSDGKRIVEAGGGNSINLVCGVAVSELVDVGLSLLVLAIQSGTGKTSGEVFLDPESLERLGMMLNTKRHAPFSS